MLKRVAVLAGLTALLGVAFVPAAHASPPFSLSVQIGPRVPVAPYGVAPRGPAGYVWQEGYYVRTPYGDQWVPGRWIPDPYLRGTVRGYRNGELREREWREREWRGDRDGYWSRDRDDRRDWDRPDRRYDRDDNRGYGRR